MAPDGGLSLEGRGAEGWGGGDRIFFDLEGEGKDSRRGIVYGKQK